jgi:hypothetical protein
MRSRAKALTIPAASEHLVPTIAALSGQYRPYDLAVVPHSQIDHQFFYCMSAAGVTHTHNTEITHMTLSDFERDYFLYKEVSKMRFFSRFRVWKAFRLWRGAILRAKAAHARKQLTTGLMQLQSGLSETIKTVVGACEDLKERISLQPLRLGQARDVVQFLVRSLHTYFVCSSFLIHQDYAAAAGKYILQYKWNVNVPSVNLIT